MSWLATRPDAVRTATPEDVLSEFPKYQAEKERLQKIWGGNTPWSDLVLAALRLYEAML